MVDILLELLPKMYFTHNCRFSVPSIAIGHHLRQIVAQGIIADRFKCKKVFGKMEKKIVVVLIRRLHGWLTIQQAMSQATIKVFFVSSRLCFLHLKRTLYNWITIASLGIFVHQKNYYIFLLHAILNKLGMGKYSNLPISL